MYDNIDDASGGDQVVSSSTSSSSFMLAGGARKNKEGGDDAAAGGTMLLLGDTIRASTPGLPMLDGLELVVIRLDRTTGAASSITLLVTDRRDPTRYGYRQELTAAQFAANFREDLELLERATERGFARQNGLVPGQWMRMTFQDGTGVRGEIVDLVEDMITVRVEPQQQEDEEEDEEDEEDEQTAAAASEELLMYIDFAYRGVPPEIVTLALIEPPFRQSATAASSTFAPEPLDQLQQLVDEAERQMERENLAAAAAYQDDDAAAAAAGDDEEQQAIFGADDDADFAAAIAASSSSLAGGFDTYTIAVQVDVLVTAMLSRYTDAQRTSALLLRVQRAVQRYCYTRRTGMAHEGERALHWIVPPPCPVTALTEQQAPIGADTYGQRGRSTRAQPIPIMPRWLLPVVAAQSALCVLPGELENANKTAPPDMAPLSLALEVIDRDRNVKELERSDNADGRRSGRVHAESLRLWRDPILPLLPSPTGGGSSSILVGTVPEIRSRGGVQAVVSNFDLADFEHTSGAWDEDMRMTRKKKKASSSSSKKKKGKNATQQKKAPRRKQQQQQQPNSAFDSEAEEASAPSSGAETEDVNSDDDDESVDRVFRRRRSTSAAATPGSIDFGSSSEDEGESVVAGGDGGDDYEPDEAPSDNDERMDEQEQQEDVINEEEDEGGNDDGMTSSVPVTFMRRQTSDLVRLVPPLVAVVARQFTGRDHPDFSTLPAPERGYALMTGDAAAVRSVLCVPPTAASSARSSLFERIAAAEVAVPSSEYVAYMRGRPVTDVTQRSWWRQQQQQQQKKSRTTALVHATLDLEDPTVAALDDSARLEMLVDRTAPSGSDLLQQPGGGGAGGRLTSLDRVMHALAPACAALRGPGDAALLRQVLTRAQRAARQLKDRRARQMRVITEARYADEMQQKKDATTTTTTAVDALVAELVSSSQERQKKEQQQQARAVELLGHLQAEYLPAGRRGAFSSSSSSSTPSSSLLRLLPATSPSEQLLGWLRQDGGAALSALVAHATAHLEPNVPLLLERGARPQLQGGDQCGPRVLAKTYASTADMLADAAPMFDADLDPVDYALARRLKEAHAKEMKGRRADGLYDYILGDIERTQAYGPGVDYPRFARSMVLGKHAVVPGNYAVVREGDREPAFYVRRQAEQGGPAVWVRDPEVQSDAAFMTTEAMLCEIRSLRAPTTGKHQQQHPENAFCLASSSSSSSDDAKRPKQCMSGLALVEQKRTALLDEIARRQRAVHRVSQQMWLARARHRGKRVAPPAGMQHMITGDRAMRARAGRGGVVVGSNYYKNGGNDAAGAADDNDGDDDARPRRAEDSPHFSLWRRIDGGEHELGPEARFEAIAAFARAVCRDPISGTNESPHWLVCKDSGAPLVPIVLRDLAAAFLAGHGGYTALLARLLNEAEDAGEAYVHGPTGTILSLVESATEYHFDEEGMAVADRTQEMRETRAARGVAQQLAAGGASAAAAAATAADLAAESELAALARTGDGSMLHRYVLLLTHHLGAGTGPRLRRAALQMALDIAAHPRVVPNKKSYELSVAKLMKQQQQQQQKQKAPLEYDALVRQRKIAAAAAAVLVAVQTNAAAAAVARDVFRGCIATFSGFPLDPDARQREAIEYVACVLSAVSRDDDGARGLFSTAKETAHLIERAILGVAVADIPSVQRALNEKRLALQQQQQQQQRPSSLPPPPPPTRDDEAFFVPPLRPTPPAMLGSSTGSVRMRRLAMALVHALRHQLSRQQLLLLTRKAQLPILSNACCETRRVSALLDYAQRDPEVRQILREMFAAAAAAASPTAMSAACGAALRALPRHRAARRSSTTTTTATTTLVTKLGTLNRARIGALSNAAAAAVFKRLPVDQASLTAPSLMAQMHGAKGKGPPVDRDGRPLDAAALELLQKVADDADPQTTLTGIFRQTLLPPRRIDAASATTTTTASSSSSHVFAPPVDPAAARATASMRRMMAMVAAADKFEARTAATEGQAIRDLRDALQSTLVAQLGMLQAFLKAFCPAREPPIALSAADYGNAQTLPRYTDYASLMRLGGAWFARTVLTEMSGRRQQQQGAAGQPLFFFQDRVATVMRTALENGNTGGAGLSAETGAAQMFDYYSDLANAWGCVYARRVQHEDKDAILVPKPHKHWGLDADDFDLLYSRTDLPFQRFTAAPGVMAGAAMAGVVSGGAEARAMWTTATDLYLREFRTSGEAFRRRATAWIPSVVTTAAAAAATTSSAMMMAELAQMGCLCTLLHACLMFADASGAPGDNSVTGLPPSDRQRMGLMAQYLSRLTITLRTGEQPSRAEPAATSYIQIAERIAFSNDREKESLKQKFRSLANDPLAARLERQLKKLGFGQYGIDAKRLNRYGERNRQGFISHDLNEPGTNAYDAARKEPREREQQDEEGDDGGDNEYDDGDEEMEDFGDIDEYGREHDD